MKITCPHCEKPMTAINRHNILRLKSISDLFRSTLVCRNCGTQAVLSAEVKVANLPPDLRSGPDQAQVIS